MMTQLAHRLQTAAGRLTSSPLWHPRTPEERNARLLYLNTASIGVPAAGIGAFIAVFMARLGASPAILSWLTSAPAFIAMLALIPGAVIAERNRDQVKVRCNAIRTQRLVFLLCAVLPFFLPGPLLLIPLVVLWAAKTVPESVSTPAWTAVIAHAISPTKRAQVNATRWALLSVVSAVASAFFGWMLDRVAFPLNYQLVFFLSFAFGWLDPLFFAKIQIDLLDLPEVSAAQSLFRRIADYFRPVLAHRPFLVVMALMIPYRFALNLPAPLFSLFWVNTLQAPDTLIGLRGTVGHTALVFGYVFWGRMAKRLGQRRLMAFSALGLALYPIVTGLAPTAAWLLPAAAIWGLTASGIDVGLFEVMLSAMPGQRQPLFAAVWSIIANAAAFAGPLVGAALAQRVGLGTALLVAGGAQVLAIALFIWLPRGP